MKVPFFLLFFFSLISGFSQQEFKHIVVDDSISGPWEIEQLSDSTFVVFSQIFDPETVYSNSVKTDINALAYH